MGEDNPGTAATVVDPASPVRSRDVGDVIDLLASRWTVVVVTALENGRSRFGELRNETGMSAQLLSKTLKRLEAAGLVDRTVHPEVPPRVEYELNDLGASLCPVVKSVNAWAYEHADEVARSRRNHARKD